ncbi:MAG: hypothetical protein AAFV53_33530 [Myxococcota bacterium]
MTPAERLERTLWDLFWLPGDARVYQTPQMTVLHSPRPIGYLNCVVRIRLTVDRADDAIATVGDLHAHTTSRWQITDTWDAGPVERRLEQAGYAITNDHHVRMLPVDDFHPRAAANVVVRPVRDLKTLRDCIAVAVEAFGHIGTSDEAILRDELAECTRPQARVHRFVVYDAATGAPISSGGLNHHPDLQLGFLWSGGTVPNARGRGAYSALVAARVDAARRLGIRWVGTYARKSSSSPIIGKQGFQIMGTMRYWERAAQE